MAEPVGISFMGGVLIVVSAGVFFGLLACALKKTTARRTFFDVVLGTTGGFVVIFVLPMQGFTLSNVTGWQVALSIGAALPIIAGHVLLPSGEHRN